MLREFSLLSLLLFLLFANEERREKGRRIEVLERNFRFTRESCLPSASRTGSARIEIPKILRDGKKDNKWKYRLINHTRQQEFRVSRWLILVLIKAAMIFILPRREHNNSGIQRIH